MAEAVVCVQQYTLNGRVPETGPFRFLGRFSGPHVLVSGPTLPLVILNARDKFSSGVAVEFPNGPEIFSGGFFCWRAPLLFRA